VCILIYFSLPGGSPVVVKPNFNEGKAKVVPAGEVLEGFVKDAETGRLLDEVVLTLLDYDDVHGKTPKCRTDSDGRFRFRDLPASPQPLQRVRLVARKDGYVPSDTYTLLGQNALPVTLKPATAPEHLK